MATVTELSRAGACRSALQTRESPRQGAELRADGTWLECKLPRMRSSSPTKTVPATFARREAE